MYKITCCRKGQDIRNRKYKGCFIKEFDTLSEISKFIIQSYNRLCFPNLSQELTRKEEEILYKKFRSLLNKGSDINV